MTYKHKMHAVDSDGKIIPNADLDFYISEVSCGLVGNLTFPVNSWYRLHVFLEWRLEAFY